MVSSALAVQLLSSSICKPWLGSFADSLEASKGSSNNNGRLMVMALGLLWSTIITLMHSLGSLWMNNDTDKIPMGLFAYHLLLRALFSVGTSAATPVLDGLTLAQLEREGRDTQEYGKERVYGAVSWGIAHICFGPLIDQLGFKTLYATIVLACIGCITTFYLYAKTSATAQFNDRREKDEANDSVKESCNCDEASALIQLQQKEIKYQCITSPQDDQLGGGKDASSETEHTQERLSFVQLVGLFFRDTPILNISYLISVFTLFVGMAVVESLIFLYFEFLGGSNTMDGFTVLVTVLFELPLFQYAPEVLNALGSVNLLQWACVAYVVRVVGYSFIPQSHPYLVLFLEPLHGITIAFATTSTVAFADEHTPAGYEASGQGLLSMIRSFGMFVGLCVGGLLEGRKLYRVLAGVVTLGSLTLGIGNYLATKPVTKKEGPPTPHHTPIQDLTQAEMA